jgi:hypothetical protein
MHGMEHVKFVRRAYFLKLQKSACLKRLMKLCFPLKFRNIS